MKGKRLVDFSNVFVTSQKLQEMCFRVFLKCSALDCTGDPNKYLSVLPRWSCLCTGRRNIWKSSEVYRQREVSTHAEKSLELMGISSASRLNGFFVFNIQRSISALNLIYTSACCVSVQQRWARSCEDSEEHWVFLWSSEVWDRCAGGNQPPGWW